MDARLEPRAVAWLLPKEASRFLRVAVPLRGRLRLRCFIPDDGLCTKEDKIYNEKYGPSFRDDVYGSVIKDTNVVCERLCGYS